MANQDRPSTPHVFGQGTLDFKFDAAAFMTHDTVAWPGAAYDEDSLFAPGTFDTPRHIKRKTTKDAGSPVDQPRTASKTTVRGEQKHTVAITRSKKKVPSLPPAPQYHRPPPPRDPPLNLLNLPGELRNNIHRMLCVRDEPILAHFRMIMRPKKGLKNKTFACIHRRFPREPGLALVCRQLHREVLFVFYSENAFLFRKKDISKPSEEPDYPRPVIMGVWTPKFGFDMNLTHLVVEYHALDSLGVPIFLSFSFRKLLGKGKFELTHNLEDYLEHCICPEENVVRDANFICVKNPLENETVLTLAYKFAGLRKREYETMRVMQNEYPCSLFRPLQTTCVNCGLGYMMEVEGGV